MDTRQKTRSVGNQNRSRSAKKKKKANSLQQILGGGQKKKPGQARAAASQQSRRAPAPRQSHSESRNGEVRRSREAAASQKAPQMQARSEYAPDQALPEMVFQTEPKETGRVRTPEDNKRSAMRRRSAKRAQERKLALSRSKKRPAVTYTQPKPFNLNQLLLQLALVIAVVLAVVIGLSVFFKVDKVMVYGNNAYGAWTVQEASGIEKGDNLLTFGNPRACGKIMTALPYVKDVRIGIKLPDTVNIYIEEYDVAYAISTEDGTWWLMTSTGRVVEQIDAGTAAGYTKVLGVELDAPAEGKQAQAVETVVAALQSTQPDDSTEPTSPVVVVTGADRLRAALLILEALELNDIVGEAASIDVSSLNNIELQYGQRYLVKLGNTGDMEHKIASMKQAVAQLNDYQTGILDVSFTTWPDGPFYTPYA